MTRQWLWCWAACTFLSTACVGGSSSSSSKERPAHDAKAATERLKAFILDAPPADLGEPLNIDFDGKLKLVGAHLEASSPGKPGDRVKLTLYWQAQKKIEGEWKLFTHIVDGAGERILNIDTIGPLREPKDGLPALPPMDWQTGKTYVDEQVFTIPARARGDKLQVMTGVFKGRGERMKVTSGPHDAQNRATVATLALTGHPLVKGGHIPSLRVEKLEPGVKIKIDGKLDEAAWQSAATTGPLLDVTTGAPNKTLPENGDVKLLWSDEGMYVGFSVADTDIIGGFKKTDKDPHLWTHDAIEIMVDPDGEGDNKDYYEIQINAQNLVFDSQFDDYNLPKVEPDGPFGHQEWSANLKSAVSVDGTVDKSDEDRGYTIEALLPWKSFSKALKIPPEAGSTWRMNFYVMDKNNGIAWSPIMGQGNFHRAPRFGRVTWVKKAAPDGAAAGAGGAASVGTGGASGAAGAPTKPAPKKAVAPAPAR